MSKVLIIGAGGVGTVVAHKVAQHPEGVARGIGPSAVTVYISIILP